jgi:hypothetical protein
MEAMEAFRAESEFGSNPPEDALPERRSLFKMGRKNAEEAREIAPDGLPKLDERSQALASISIPTGRGTTVRARPKRSPWPRRITFLGIAFLLLIVTWFAYPYAVSHWNRPPDVPDRQFRNPAEQMLQRDADPVQTLTEAVAAQSKEDHPFNREVLEKSRARVVKQVRELLEAKPWREELLVEAMGKANAAFKVDVDATISQLKREVEAEVNAYRMSVISIDGKTAELAVNPRLLGQSGGEAKVSVDVGDKVGDRFEVIEVRGDKVRMRDLKRSGRELIYTKGDTRILTP